MNITDTTLRDYGAHIRTIILRAEKMVVGKKAKIISSYNGQPYGRSRPPQTGRIVTIERAIFNEWNDTFSFKVKEKRLYIDLDELELHSMSKLRSLAARSRAARKGWETRRHRQLIAMKLRIRFELKIGMLLGMALWTAISPSLVRTETVKL